jgi:hypothetical protein
MLQFYLNNSNWLTPSENWNKLDLLSSVKIIFLLFFKQGKKYIKCGYAKVNFQPIVIAVSEVTGQLSEPVCCPDSEKSCKKTTREFP